MVLQPRGCGRVGRRRTYLCVGPSRKGWPYCHLRLISAFRLLAGGDQPRAVPRPQRRLPSGSSTGRSLAPLCWRRGPAKSAAEVMGMATRSEQVAQTVSVNEVRLVGRVSNVPERRELPSGDELLSFR